MKLIYFVDINVSLINILRYAGKRFVLNLTHLCINSVFRLFLRCNLKFTHIVYRLIGAVLIGNFSMIRFYFTNEVLAKQYQFGHSN